MLKNHKGRPKPLVIFLLITIILGGFIAFLLWPKEAGPQFPTARLKRGTVRETVTASGIVLSTGRQAITTTATGKVSAVFIQNDQKVAKDQKLVEIEPDREAAKATTDAWASYLSTQSSLELARAALFTTQAEMFTKWKTYLDLAQSSTYQNSDLSPREDQRSLPQFHSTKNEWLAAEAKFKNQKNLVAQHESGLTGAWLAYQLSAPTILAPVSGEISDLLVSEEMIIPRSNGATVQTIKIGNINSRAKTIVSVNLSEVDVQKVRPAMAANITFDPFPGKNFSAKVVGVDRTGQVSSGVTNYPAVLEIINPDGEILPNMSASATVLVTEKENVLVVPTRALVTEGDQTFVRVRQNGRIRQIRVSVGVSSDIDTEITAGLTENDEIIVSAVPNQRTAPAVSPFNASFRFGPGLRR